MIAYELFYHRIQCNLLLYIHTVQWHEFKLKKRMLRIIPENKYSISTYII